MKIKWDVDKMIQDGYLLSLVLAQDIQYGVSNENQTHYSVAMNFETWLLNITT